MRLPCKLTRVALMATALCLAAPVGRAQQSSAPKRVLLLNWYDRDYPVNRSFEQQFVTSLRALTPASIEYYSEYLETNKFPGENQSELLAEYLGQKYADRPIDVVVTRASPSLDFLLTYRRTLFPNTPIVFATERPVEARAMAAAGATGIVYTNTHAKTIDLARRLQPGIKRVFIVNGTLTHDKAFEAIARDELQSYNSHVEINYLTDLTPDELKVAVKRLPSDSILLWAWQQARNQQGQVMESREILAAVAPEASVPIYAMSFANIGSGPLGGQVYTLEGNAAKLSEMVVRVVDGTRAGDIPVERAPDVPMFDWRQLQRWGIHEDRLPPGSIIRFREPSFWQQYQGRIIAAIAIFLLQAFLIGALLVQRLKSRRAQEELKQYKEHLENLVQERTAELVEARDQAMGANRSKTVFLAHMSHELRTPLNAILGFSGIVLRDADLSEQHRKDLAIVGSSGQHLLGLIDDVLDMAKIETGSVTVESVSFDLHLMVNETVAMLREIAQAKNLELFLEVSPRVPRFVRSDPGKLRQVFTNLVGNALKYTEEGRVVVRLDAGPAGNGGNPRVTFDIEDTGIGIDEGDRERIFDAFVQAAAPRSRKGVGLGLSISRRFVQLLGGSIHVESVVGKGSHFHMEVPVQTATGSEVTTPKPGVEAVAGLEPGQPDYRILIVEDHRDNRLLLERLLQTAGFQVRVAEDGGQAVEAFKTWRPHFIWMDLSLPVLTGLQAAGQIRKIEGGADVKIVAVTASAFSSQREEVLAAGFDDFLRKPYLAMELFECMARHLGVRYRYHPAPQAAESPAPLRAADLSALTQELRDELEQAVLALDAPRIAVLVRRISEQNASLGGALKQFADRYAYTPIHDALRSCRARPAGTPS